MSAPAATPPRFLTQAETFHLFTCIWQHRSDAPAARETLIAQNLRAVRNVIVNHPAFSWYEPEDAEQEAYRILLEALAKVPPFTRRPGAYLYKVACTLVLQASISILPVASLDAPLPGREETTLSQMMVSPSFTASQTQRSPLPLYAALHRLPLGQQQALHDFFQFDDFQPQANSRRVSPLPDRSKKRTDLRSRAYHNLRQDQELQAMVLPHLRRTTVPPVSPLRHYRLLHRWTQRQVADRVGVHPSIVGRWEVGSRTPDGFHREQLCHVYGVTAEQLGLKKP